MSPTKCVPSKPAVRCQFCQRWAKQRPVNQNYTRDLVCIDASAILAASRCPLYIGGPRMFYASQIGGAA